MTGTAGGSTGTGTGAGTGTPVAAASRVTPVPPSADATVAARALAARRTRGALAAARARLRGTPGRLRIAGIAAVLGCLAFALLGASASQARADALAQARAHAGQLVRVQTIASQVVSADSQFTNGFLAFGLASPGQLTSYDEAVSAASELIAEAAGAEPADAADLATVTDALTEYTARVEAARAGNRLGLQVGVGYLRQASTILQSPAAPSNLLPTLRRLADTNSARVDDAFAASARAGWRLAAAAVLGLGVLAVVQVWLARRVRRIINLPLAVATVAVVVALAVGGLAMVTAQRRATDVRDGSYAATLALANARIAVSEARSYENITLIYVGTGGNYPASQDAYEKQIAIAKAQLAQAARTGSEVGAAQLKAWTAANAEVYRAARDDWVPATRQATADGAGTVNGRFAALDAATRPELARQAEAVDDGLDRSRGALSVTSWLALVLGIAAALASWLGISLRLEEYR